MDEKEFEEKFTEGKNEIMDVLKKFNFNYGQTLNLIKVVEVELKGKMVNQKLL